MNSKMLLKNGEETMTTFVNGEQFMENRTLQSHWFPTLVNGTLTTILMGELWVIDFTAGMQAKWSVALSRSIGFLDSPALTRTSHRKLARFKQLAITRCDHLGFTSFTDDGRLPKR